VPIRSSPRSVRDRGHADRSDRRLRPSGDPVGIGRAPPPDEADVARPTHRIGRTARVAPSCDPSDPARQGRDLRTGGRPGRSSGRGAPYGPSSLLRPRSSVAARGRRRRTDRTDRNGSARTTVAAPDRRGHVRGRPGSNGSARVDSDEERLGTPERVFEPLDARLGRATARTTLSGLDPPLRSDRTSGPSTAEPNVGYGSHVSHREGGKEGPVRSLTRSGS